MFEAIINFLNLKLELLNYFEQQHCLCELKSDNEGKVAPVEYVGDGNYTIISHDEFDGVSYWRLRDKPTQDVLETKYQAGKRVEVKIPLRLVFSVRRTKLTTDDAYAFDRIRQTIVKQFNFDDGILKTTLGAESVTVSVPTSNGNAKDVWDEETSETGTYEPNYSFVYGSIDIEVAVIYKGSCLPTECHDIDSNILHAFDFCKPSVVAQLTAEQVACLEADLCIPLCDQLALVAPEDVVVDVFDCLSEAAQTELLDSECVIPPCADATVEINSTLFDTVASGATIDIPVINGGSNPVGSLQVTDWVIGNNMTTINGTQVTDQEAEVNAAIFATLDGSQSGSWNAGTQTWEMTSAPCADATVHNSNNSYSTTVASGGDLPLPNINKTDSDGTVTSIPSMEDVVCTPANYGTRILTILMLKYGIETTVAFGLKALTDAYISLPLIRVRRSGDNLEANFTESEITNGTLTAWVIAGGGTTEGFIRSFYDHTGNGYTLGSSTAGFQEKIVSTGGVLVVDSNGNPTTTKTVATANYNVIRGTGINNGRLGVVSTAGSFWCVGKRGASAASANMLDYNGNPAIGISETSAFQPDNGAGSPSIVVNGTALSPDTRTQLNTVVTNTEAITLMTQVDWTAGWSTVSLTVFNIYPVGSQFSEVVVFNKNISAHTAEIQTYLNTYYGYY